MTASPGDDAVTYQERDATPGEADRGRVFEELADGNPYVFLYVIPTVDDGLKLRMDASEVLDAETIRSLLVKAAAAIR